MSPACELLGVPVERVRSGRPGVMQNAIDVNGYLRNPYAVSRTYRNRYVAANQCTVVRIGDRDGGGLSSLGGHRVADTDSDGSRTRVSRRVVSLDQNSM